MPTTHAFLCSLRMFAVFFAVVLVDQTLHAQQTVVFDGKSFYKVDDERMKSLRIVEWQIRLYKSAADQAANKSNGLITGSSAESCLAQLQKGREQNRRFNRFANQQDDGTENGYRFASAPYAVVPRGSVGNGARRAAADSAGDREERAREVAEKKKQEAERQQALQAQRAERERLAEQAADARREAERIQRERMARAADAERLQAERAQAAERVKILDRTVDKLERLQSQQNAINQAFSQLNELIQAQMERDRARDELRQAQQEEREARREAADLERREEEARERAEQRRMEREDLPAAREAYTPPAAEAPDEAAEIVSMPPAYAEPRFAADAPPIGSSARSGASGESTPTMEEAPVASAPPSPRYGKLFDRTEQPAARGKDASSEALKTPLGSKPPGADTSLMGQLLRAEQRTRPPLGDDASGREAQVIKGLLDDAKLASDTAKAVVRGEDPPGSGERSVLDRLFDRYSSERDARLLGPDAKAVGKGRAVEDALDQVQQQNADRIPELVRAEGDAWRMLFARGASGDLAGHVKGHVDFAQRWVFDRIETDAAPPAPTGASGGSASASRPPLRPSSLSSGDRDAMQTARQAARAAAEATSLRERAVQLRRVLRATETLPANPDARRSALYLRAAATLDLADPAACRAVRAELRTHGVDVSVSPDERALLRALEEQSKP